MLDLLYLKHFYFVAKENGFTKAAKALRVAQPSLSRSVKMLSEDLGVPLFEKAGRNVRLTKAGGDIFRHCENIFAEIEKVEQLGKSSKGTYAGSFSIGAAEPVASHFLPPYLVQLLKDHPQVSPSVITAPTADLITRLLNRQIEMAFVFYLPEVFTGTEIRAKIKIAHEVVVASSHKKNTETLQSFVGSREVDISSTKDFPTLKKLRSKYPAAEIRISSNSLTAHKHYVLQGLGVASLPKFLIEKELRRGTLVPVFPKEKFEWPLQVVSLAGQTLSPVGEEFLRMLA